MGYSQDGSEVTIPKDVVELGQDVLQTYQHCMSCTEQPCMNACERHLYVPEEMERVQRLMAASTVSSAPFAHS